LIKARSDVFQWMRIPHPLFSSSNQTLEICY